MSALTEDAFHTAFILAFSLHLDSLKARFDAISEDPSSSIEQCCYVEELSIGLRVVKNYGLRTLASAHGTGSCTLLSAHFGEFAKKKLSTEELVERVDDQKEELNPLAQDPALLAKLYSLLQAAVQMATNLEEKGQLLLLAQHISQLLVRYLYAQEKTDLKILLGGMSSAAIAHLKEGLQVDVSWESVYALFKHLLSLQVDLAPSSLNKVLELREVGNDLMANCCYPQAVKVYTEAIENSGFAALNNLPQLHTNRAIAFIGLNCFAEAVSDLQAAVLLDRTFTPAWAQLGYCHLYLGLGLLALKCYLVALRTIAGEIYPLHLSESKLIYTEAKMNTVFPQFVQRLVQSILLTEKRAEQQQEPSSSIQEITTRVRAILARLRSYVATEDVHYLAYAYESNMENTRSTAARANRVRPTILTPDVAQDILASTSVEASAVTVLPPPLASFATHTVPTVSGSPPSPPNAEAQEEPSIREMFNNLGEVFASVIPENRAARQNTGRENEGNSDARESEAARETRGNGQSQNAENPAENLDEELDPVSRAIASAQRVFSPSNESFTVGGFEVPGSFGTIISQALRNHQAAYRNETRPNGVRVSVHQHPPRERTERRTDSPRPEDTEMPDAQDLD